MNANDIWNAAQSLEGITLHEWTKNGKLGEPFSYEIRDASRGLVITFFRDRREVKSASFDRFCRFFEKWSGGQRSADAFHNDGRLQSVAQVARFLIPVFEMTVRSVIAKRLVAATAMPAIPAAPLVNHEHAVILSGPSLHTVMNQGDFDTRLRQLVSVTDLSRPFMCSGDPLVAELFIVGLNPGTDTPFWPFWNGSTFDKEAWLQEYLRQHCGQFHKTRRYLERLIGGLDGVPYLETNLYPYPSRQFEQLPSELQKPHVLEFLVTTIRPRVMFIMGKETIEYVCEQAKIKGLPKDERFTTLKWADITIDVMAENHFAIRNKYWDDRKVDRIMVALKARALELGNGAEAGSEVD